MTLEKKPRKPWMRNTELTTIQRLKEEKKK
jgi:hypothetical protein